MPDKEEVDLAADLGCVIIEGEVSGLKDVDFSLRNFPGDGLGAFDGEDGVVSAPGDERGRAYVAKVFLPRAVSRYVRLVVVNQA